jgi:hypothetical protein
MKSIYCITALALLTLNSCSGKSGKQGIISLVNEWNKKEVVFPDNIAFTRFIPDSDNRRIFTLDTVDYPPQADYKVLIYVDSTGCTECRLKLSRWKMLMARMDSISAGSVPFLFVFHPKSVDDIYYIFQVDYFDYPVYIDEKDELNRLNRFPPEEAFHTFLLDKDNKVIAIGNPVLNPDIEELYLNQIKLAAPVAGK